MTSIPTTDSASTDIAIVGMSGRFPGAADVDGLWQLLRDGRSGLSTFSDDELRASGVSEQLLADPNYVKSGAVIEGIDLFDAGFFGVGVKEAQVLDPQQRLFLEHSWHALEDAGCDPARFPGSVGVFGGCAWSSYLQHNLGPSGVAAAMGELAVGLANDKDSLATRVAHTLGLTGPAYAVQSYCSTSLVAVCAAATSLANYECDVALAGGAAVSVPHRVGYLYQAGGIAPPDGECRAFDAAGLGAPLGSGVGVVALTRLDEALARGDRIYAVIRGWAVNNDGGRKVGFTAPGVQGQLAVIAEALSSADLQPADIDYLEAHGTGTALGDAAELAALQQVFSDADCQLGSVKTNLGHLDRAAGVTGLIKTVLALQHEQLPPTRNLRNPNPQLSTGTARLEVVTELRPWPRRDGRARRAGVSAFGIGGTNAHVVLEEPPLTSRPAAAQRLEVLIWSARSAAAADAHTVQLADHLDEHDDALDDVAHTLQTGRRPFEHRRALVADSPTGAVGAMRNGQVLAAADVGGGRGVAFLIAGTGEQYPGLARELYDAEPVFRAAVEQCRGPLVEHLGGRDPLAEMLAPRVAAGSLAGLLGRSPGAEPGQPATATELLQPATFAVGYALTELLRSCGLTPDVVAGYSVGEYVAACLSGVLTLDDALALVAYRAKLISALPAGAMAAVPVAAAQLRRRLADWDVDIAAVNGPQLTVLSGAPDALARASSELAAEGVPSRPLATSHAFHSRMLTPVAAELTAWIAEHVTLHPPQVATVSNVTGTLLTEQQATDPGYWAAHMCSAVQFETALGTVLGHGEQALVELGPGRSLGALASGHPECSRERWARVVATLPAGADPRPAPTVFADALARLWLGGVDVDWAGYRSGNGARTAHTVGLPGYPFQRERYWIDPPRPAPTTVQPTAQPAGEPDVAVLYPTWRPAPHSAGAAPTRCRLVGGPAELAEPLAEALRADGIDTMTDAPEVVVDLRALEPTTDPDPARHVLPIAALADQWSGAALVVVTIGGQAVRAGERPDPAQAAAAALPVVAAQEYGTSGCRTIDLDPAEPTDALVAVLRAELHVAATDTAVAYRTGVRHVRDHAPDGGDTTPVTVRSTGTYLVTGGLGEVGQLIAAHLARAGAGRLVLTGRRAGQDHPGAAALRELGAEVVVASVDVTDAAAMRTLVDGLDRLDGVVHLAAQTAPGTFRPLRTVDADAVATHFAAKVGGAQVLAEVLADRPVDFCLLFSSTSALLGGLAFGSYAAANAALAALAQREDGRGGTRWLAPCWDTWAATLDKLDAGAGVGAAMRAHAMSAPQALNALDRLFAHPAPTVVIAAGGVADRLPAPSGPVPALAPAPTERFPRPDLPQPYAAPVTGTERDLAEVWSDVLGVEPVGTHDNFFDLGGNSLLALTMLARTRDQFAVAIPTVDLFEAPTVQALAARIAAQGGATTPAAVPIAASQPTRSHDGDASGERNIAVVGMAGRFPGAGDVAAFWRNLCDGVESISFFSRDELLAAGVDEATIDDPAYVPARPVLDDVRGFDAGFFGISPRMAALTDPQQRLFLEVCWEALEQAGYAAPEHRGRVGVYGGTNLSTYLLQMPADAFTSGDVSTYEIIMGNDKDALTTTVSYLFDLHGPSVAVQTFCSTSLVATHLAVQALRNRECELALAGGVSIRVPNKVGHTYAPGGQESPDGHVRTFDAQARGSMFGDGAATIVLKRLDDALRDGDHIWSVIRGTAMNNDGALKVGYTAPSVTGQAQVVADAHADAGITGADVDYIEAHGTATELGDPIEVAALTRAFGAEVERNSCAIGSVKTNVGHLDRAAGVTGLIKTSLALHERVIPPTLHYTSPNPEIDFGNSPFYVNTELSAWPTRAPAENRAERIPMAGINSLGMGGTNVHVVLAEAPRRQRHEGTEADEATRRRYHVLPVSARTESAADQACARLQEHLDANPDLRLADVAYTLQVGRKTFEHRRAAIAEGVAEAASALGGKPLAGVQTAHGVGVAFLFTGVGEQYPGMVAELYRREPEFRSALTECLDEFDALGIDADMRDLLTGAREADGELAALLGREAPPVNARRILHLARTEVAQPALFAVEYALARTLIAWGLQPRVMLGYSLGEYVAACLAGVLSLPDALRLVARRAQLIATVAPGAMLAVGADEAATAALCERFGLDNIDIAAANGPQVTVVSGPAEEIHRLAARLRAENLASRPLRTTGAFHSRMLHPVREELTAWVRENITLQPPAIPYISNVTGTYATPELVCDPGYWARHMCQTVQFATGVQTLLAEPGLVVVELGPGQSLGALIRSSAPREQLPTITSTLPAASDPRPDDAVLTGCLSRLWLAGVDIDWRACHGRDRIPAAPDAPGRIPLPTYPFQRQQYWIEGTPGAVFGATPATGTAAPDPDAEVSLDLIAAFPKSDEQDWLYLPVWRQTAGPAAAEPSRGWLVYTCDGIAEHIPAGLPTTGEIRLVRPGEGYARTADGYTVRPGSVEDAVAMLRDLRADGQPLDRVLHLWTLDGTPDESVVPNGLHTLAALARAAGEVGETEWALDVVVAGTQHVLAGDAVNPLAATLTGPCRVIPLEYPDVRTRLIDLDADPIGPATARAVVAELARPHGDALVALRHGRRWLPGYETITESADAPLREGGVYLITGGLGGIALGMAQRLVRDLHAKLVLLSRRPRPEQLPDGLEVDVEIVTGDVADPDDVRRAMDVAFDRFGALHGVLHVAGLPGAGLMQFKRPAELDAVLAPKVGGALAIADALRIGKPDEIQLDFLAFFSSITSATGGGPGQVDYCAANAFLDSYASSLASDERRVVSIGWSEWTWNGWEDALAGYDESLQQFFRDNRKRIGIGFEEGWRALGRALSAGEPHVVVCTQDFPTMVRYASKFTVAAVTEPSTADATLHPRPELVTPYEEPAGAEECAIAAIWCEALRVERVGVQDNFFELGGNSLLGVSIVAALRQEFPGADLPPHVLYETPTVASLAAALHSGADREKASEASAVRAQLRRSGVQSSAQRRRGN